MDFPRPRDYIPSVSSSKLLILTFAKIYLCMSSTPPQVPLALHVLFSKTFFSLQKRLRKSLMLRCKRLMRVNGYPLSIGLLPFNRGKLTSNSGMKSTNSLDEGGYFGRQRRLFDDSEIKHM